MVTKHARWLPMSTTETLYYRLACFAGDPAYVIPKIPLGFYVTEASGQVIKVRVAASKYPSADYLGRASHHLMQCHVEDFGTAKTVSDLQNRGPHIHLGKVRKVPSGIEGMDAVETWLAGMLP